MKTINTQGAPEAIGPYAQAVVVGNMLYTSGQIPLTHEGVMVAGDIALQTVQVFKNLTAIIEAAGASLSQVVKTTVFLKNIDDFGEMNAEYARAFGGHTPARSTIEVSKLPKDALVEIEAIVLLD